MPQLYFSNTTAESRKLSAQAKSGIIKRIYKGIYTDAALADIEKVVQSKWYDIVNYLMPSAIAAFRTAHELVPINNTVFVVDDVSKRRNVVVFSSLTIVVIPGNIQNMVEPFLPQMLRTTPTRQYLENLSESRGKHKKSLGQIWVEQRLCIEMQRSGEMELNKIRDGARKFHLECGGFEIEFEQLNAIISSLLSTNTSKDALVTDIGLANARKEPFDPHRLTLFSSLANYLNRCELKPVDYHYNKLNWMTLSFFESYFSNYIEGTEFEIEEAEKIVFQNIEVANRHADSHDVLSVYQQVSDYQEMSNSPQTPDELIQTLKDRHFAMMVERPEKRPGQFKEKANQAGASHFVRPDEVEGTLKQAFDLYKDLPEGLARAIFMHFVVAECHPFDDGNGRLARIMMNAELHASGQYKLIVPTVHRDSYLNGLRSATRNGEFRTLVKVLYQLQQYTASIDWSDYGEAKDLIEEHCADKLPDQGIAVFNNQIRKFKFNPPLQMD
ncbi:Fic family protein [Thalassotalea sp. ND16A]|uniref:Fic family protein n=1 Tax=Thalassotalea sp. ND16A TaxID=1535422 RepID=UPI00051A7B13|nr:Fic family protein [Thalassotalea sp. ND16A]KGJ94212.1 hypothetical protein ND16A_1418 [Thalassotalea sp. ND16A]